jgi:biopolymer transport protein ExbD
MPKIKIPRKSTNIDMTAMCDVAFLLLSFFILATKQKPPEALAVTPPSSVSSKATPEKSILLTVTQDGRTFLMFGDETKRASIVNAIDTIKGLGLTDKEKVMLEKAPFIGTPFNQLKSFLQKGSSIPASKLPGIPTDSLNNELTLWIRAVKTAYANSDMRSFQEMLLVKGDGEAFYPVYRDIKKAFKSNEIYKFRIVTAGTPVPVGSELYLNPPK